MTVNNKKHLIGFRISDFEYELLIDEAEKRKLSPGQSARVVLFESLSGYDEKQESLLRRIDHLEEQLSERLSLLVSLASLGAAAGALPFAANAKELEVEVNRETLKKHFATSRQLGNSLLESIKTGKL